MASAFPSRGMSNPAARLAVWDPGGLDGGSLGPGGEIGGGVAVPVHDQPASTAVERPRPQRQLLHDPSTDGAGLGRREPAVAHHQLPSAPGGLVAKLAGELCPGGVGDGSGEVPVADQICHGEIFDGQPTVGLGELAGDLMKEASADVGDAMVLPSQRTNGFRPVSGTPPGARERPGTLPQPAVPASQRSRSGEAADLGAIGAGNDGEGGKSTVDPDEPPNLTLRWLPVAAAGMEVRSLDVQVYIPSVSSPRDRRGQDSRGRSDNGPAGAYVEVLDGTEHPTQPPGVLMHPNRSDLRQRHRSGMTLAYTDAATAARILVTETEAVAAMALALSSREADAAAAALGVSSKPSTKVDGGFFEHLGGDLRSPGEPGHLFRGSSIRSNDEDATGALASLPPIERLDQIEA